MHLRTTGVPGQGVDCRLLRLVVNSPGLDPPPASVFAIWLRLRQNVLRRMYDPFERRTVLPATSRNQTGHRGPRCEGTEGVRQPCRVPRFNRARSDRRGPARSPRRIRLRRRLSDHACAAGRADVGGRPTRRRRGWPRSSPPCSRCWAPAIMCWWPTTSAGRRAISATTSRA